jgi:hypothetical protein
MSDVFTGRISKLEIGTTAGTNTDITNAILMNWDMNHDVRPRLFANIKYPTTYQQPHSWDVGTFSVLSNSNLAIYATAVDGSGNFAMVPGADSNVIDFFQVTYEDASGNTQTTRFYYAIIYRFTKELLNYDDSVWVYHFLAGYSEDG